MDKANNISVEEAAIKYDYENFGWPQPGERVYMEERKTREWNVEAFKAGAQWQKEQLRELVRVASIVASVLKETDGPALAQELENALRLIDRP